MKTPALTAMLHVLTVLGASWLAANTVNAFALVDATPVSHARAQHGEPARIDESDAALAAISSRNVFNHGEPVPDEGVVDTGIVVARGCTLPLDLLGAVFVHGAPQLSLVTVRDRGNARVDVFQVGEPLSSGATLARVVADDEDPGRLAGIELSFVDGHRERCDAARGAALVAGKDAKPVLLGGTKHVVGEKEVRSVLDDFTPLVASMRAIPADGGFRLLGIPADSLPAHAGLKNGDVVRRVNGYEIKSPQDALQLLAVLKNERDLSVDLVREGTPQTLEVAIR